MNREEYIKKNWKCDVCGEVTKDSKRKSIIVTEQYPGSVLIDGLGIITLEDSIQVKIYHSDCFSSVSGEDYWND